jgi:hypothetical protein
LFFNQQPNQPDWVSEIDAMIVAQERGWPVFNGYSGNTPPGYGVSNRCAQLPRRILFFMEFNHQETEQFYLDMIQRAVPLGFDDCDPNWWQKKPVVSVASGPLPAESFSQLELKAQAMDINSYGIRARFSITNHGTGAIPAYSSTQNDVYLAWRLIGVDQAEPWPGFDARKRPDLDIIPGTTSPQVIGVDAPQTAGLYRLEITVVQDNGPALSDKEMPILAFHPLIQVDETLNVTIIENPNP